MRPLIWVSKSMEKLAATLTEMGHPISADTVRKELVKLGFSRQSNRKAEEGSKHPDRNAQFDYINAKVLAAQAVHALRVALGTIISSAVLEVADQGALTPPVGKVGLVTTRMSQSLRYQARPRLSKDQAFASSRCLVFQSSIASTGMRSTCSPSGTLRAGPRLNNASGEVHCETPAFRAGSRASGLRQRKRPSRGCTAAFTSALRSSAVSTRAAASANT